jgi:hypothetical protein
MTKTQKLQRNIKRLSSIFGVCAPKTSIGTAGRRTNGLYFPQHFFKNSNGMDDQARIIIDHSLSFSDSLETQAHEFAHHLDHLNGLGCVEPPHHLPTVREAIGGSTLRHTELRWSTNDRVDSSWL